MIEAEPWRRGNHRHRLSSIHDAVDHVAASETLASTRSTALQSALTCSVTNDTIGLQCLCNLISVVATHRMNAFTTEAAKADLPPLLG